MWHTNDVLGRGRVRGVYLGSQLPVDAVPGKAGQSRAEPGAALDRRNDIQSVAEIEVFFILDRRNNIGFGPRN